MTPLVRNMLMDRFRELYRAYKLSLQIQTTLEKDLAARKKTTDEYVEQLNALDTDMDLSERERLKLYEGG